MGLRERQGGLRSDLSPDIKLFLLIKMSLHIHHSNIVGVYCHGVWYKCLKGSFCVDAFEIQIYGDKRDVTSSKGSPDCDWIFMSKLHPEVPQAFSGASWIDPKTNEFVSVFLYDIKAFKESRSAA